MSKERELLKTILAYMAAEYLVMTEFEMITQIEDTIKEIQELLAQPEQTEQEPVTDKPTETAMAIMPNGVCVSNVYDAYEEGRKSVMSEQQPEAWIIVNKETGYRTQVSDLTPFLYHMEIFEVIPLYLAPPKREPLINIYVLNAFKADDEATHPYSYWAGVEFAEKHHGIVDEI